MAEVQLKNVTKVYSGDVLAVKDFNLEIHDNEFVVLVGPSGCGKSTALRMVAGLEEITSGDLYINGKRMNDVPPKDRDIAMVFQNYALYPHMNVFDNMAFGLKLRRFPKAEIRSRVEEAAEILGLSEYLDRKPKALSGGQRQRVAVGRAIVRKPQVFLFDEPLSNLDAKMRVQMRKEICQLHQRIHATMIYVTHDQIEAMTMGDRIVVMKDGVIQQADKPLTIYQNPTNMFVGGFIGSPQMNFFEGKVVDDHIEAFDKTVPIPEDLLARAKQAGKAEIIVGIRPEDLTIASDPDKVLIDSKIEITELLGAEAYIYGKSDETTFIAKAPPDVNAAIGESVRFSASPNKVHIFDKDTGVVI